MNKLTQYKNSRVLITGGLGFIGSNLARSLVSLGAKVTLVDSLIPSYGGNIFNISDIQGKVEVNICDVRDPYAIEYLLKDKDYLFNLAGQTSHIDSMTDPQTDLAINIQAQVSILESCRKHNSSIKIVFASTRQIYGRPQYLPVDEKHPIIPVDVNGINKLAGEWYHMLYSQIYGIRSCALRLTNTYGPGMRVKDARQTFLGIWVRSVIDGSPIQVFGDGMQVRDFNYIDDCVSAMLSSGLAEESNGNIYNLGHSEAISLKSLAELVIDIYGKGSYKMIPFPSDRKAIDIGDYYSDYSKITNDLGWSPKVNLADGLQNTLRFYSENKQHYWDVNQ